MRKDGGVVLVLRVSLATCVFGLLQFRSRIAMLLHKQELTSVSSASAHATSCLLGQVLWQSKDSVLGFRNKPGVWNCPSCPVRPLQFRLGIPMVRRKSGFERRRRRVAKPAASRSSLASLVSQVICCDVKALVDGELANM